MKYGVGIDISKGKSTVAILSIERRKKRINSLLKSIKWQKK